ncbi:MAG: hypothetical protein ACOYNH_07415 [Bacteroidia bacterium]
MGGIFSTKVISPRRRRTELSATSKLSRGDDSPQRTRLLPMCC